MPKTEAQNRIILATDVDEKLEAIQIVSPYREKVGIVKIGLQLITSSLLSGNNTVAAIRQLGFQIFLDMKLHDIPNTVEKAVRNAAMHGVYMITAHALGGPKMIAAAVKGAKEGANNTVFSPPIITAVTLLTSHDFHDLYKIGVISKGEYDLVAGSGDPGIERLARIIIERAVVRLAQMSVAAGAKAIVCSALEVKKVREAVGPEILLVVPGTRLPGSDHRDQKRVTTPGEAVRDGGPNTLLVVSSERNRLDEITAEIMAAA